MAAASEGLTSVVQLLLDAGADWHVTHETSSKTYPAWLHVLPHGRDEATALSLAREHGHENTVATLERWILHNGDLEEQSQLRGYQLRAAAKHGDGGRVSTILLAAGQGETSFVDAADDDGRTALWLAAWNNCVEAVSALVAARADLEKTSRHGETALMAAAVGPGGPTDALEVLLCAGADWTKRDCDSRTAETFAKDCGIDEAAALLAAWEHSEHQAALQAVGGEDY